MTKEELIKCLSMDCNSLNAIAGAIRYSKNDFNKFSGILLAIEHRIFEAIDILEENSGSDRATNVPEQRNLMENSRIIELLVQLNRQMALHEWDDIAVHEYRNLGNNYAKAIADAVIKLTNE